MVRAESDSQGNPGEYSRISLLIYLVEMGGPGNPSRPSRFGGFWVMVLSQVFYQV